jgi:hypothetical protein
VFLLGHLILNTQISWIDKAEFLVVDHLCKISASRKGDTISLSLKEEWLRNWAVASLLHDIGYQIGHGRHITNEVGAWKSYFALNTGDGPKNLHFNRKNSNPDGDPNGNKIFLNNLYEDIINASDLLKKMLPDSTKTSLAQENLITDHGMLSALRVSQVLLHVDNHHTPPTTTIVKSDMIEKYHHAVHAVAFHNLHDQKVGMENYPLACLLRLCDELQEWDRRRVNVEKVIKGLYLDIQEGRHQNLAGHDLLKAFCANISIHQDEDNSESKVLFELKGSQEPCFHFQLRYKDAVSAQFDPIMTLLSKSFCFQNLDLAVDFQKQNEIRIMVELRFPTPKDYKGMLEYDIYGMFTEEVRDLVLLQRIEDIWESDAGLVKLDDKKCGDNRHECFGIVLQQKSEIRLGWIPTNPELYRERLDKFKKEMLPHLQVP